MFVLRSPLFGKRITDDFDRTNGNLTTPWTGAGTTLTIVGNEAGLATTGASQTLYGVARHDELLITNEQAVEFRRGSVTFATSQTVAITGWTHANTGLTNGAVMALVYTSAVNATLNIYTAAAYNSLTSRGVSSAFATASGDTFTMKNVGNVFTCYHNGVSRISWTDTGGIVNLDNKGVCFGAQATSAFGGNTNARALDWAAYDLSA